MMKVSNIEIEDSPKGSWITVMDKYAHVQELAVTQEELYKIYFALKCHYEKKKKL